ncbi:MULTISPECIES: glycoside hydrolase family 97 protein [Sphingobium]|jgi:alpha-glucosidase|uniref:Glycoside hydrolase family 97 protein n=1 Tax=Sphingobium rhizovicinum TaxID=432308 RepID=A0ABV7NGK9_9SPHN|nr:glycoside hydrolase family 97 protein [Sphingobium yanoikuyae]
MRGRRALPLLALPLFTLGYALPAAAQSRVVASPDGHNRISLTLDAQGQPLWSVDRDGHRLVDPSPLGLTLDDGPLATNLALTASQASSGEDRYPIVAGKAASAADRYRALRVELTQKDGANRALTVELRAYDDGVAFRTILPVQPQIAVSVIREERTEFRVAADSRCWGFNIGSFGKSHEGEYEPVEPAKVRPHNLFDLPMLCESGGKALAITEAGLSDYAGLYLTGRGDGGPGFAARLSPALDDPRVAVRGKVGAPLASPWRLVMLADRAGDLAASTLVTSLAEPSRVAQTDWIRPGLSAWDWWNGPSLKGVDKAGTNTATAKAYIDFAAANGLPYSLIDEGWYQGAGGGGDVRPGADVMHWTPDIDLPGLIDYAGRKGVRLWLWFNWRALDADMEAALAQYARMGIAGIKVDFMDRDDQAMVAWYHRLLEVAARHKLMVNLHGAYVPRGLTRTYPNFLTQEGVMGAEYNKWSRRITADHNVMLAYTRGLLGPMDYTPGGFNNVAPADFAIRNDLPFVQTTRAHGLALYVVYESPFACVSDSPDSYAANPAGLDFIRMVPTSWDETRFLAGDVGDYVAIARRKGKRWYVGVLNNSQARQVELPIGKLGSSFKMTMWQDGEQPRDIVQASRTVADSISIDLAASGGAVLIFEP